MMQLKPLYEAISTTQMEMIFLKHSSWMLLLTWNGMLICHSRVHQPVALWEKQQSSALLTDQTSMFSRLHHSSTVADSHHCSPPSCPCLMFRKLAVESKLISSVCVGR